TGRPLVSSLDLKFFYTRLPLWLQTHQPRKNPPTMTKCRTLIIATTILTLSLSAATTAAGAPSAQHTSVIDSCSADDNVGNAEAECRNNEHDNGGNIEDVDDDESNVCRDDHPECENWGSQGECVNNPNYMLLNCRKSCDTCNEIITPTEFGWPQVIPSHRIDEVDALIKSTSSYMESIHADPRYEIIPDGCRNQHQGCSYWALGTGCDDNPRYMKYKCAPACQSCDLVLEKAELCRVDPEEKDALEKGGMDALFEGMIRVADEMGFEPKVWSRPEKETTSAIQTGGDATTSCGNDTIHKLCNNPDGPWVITLENFLSSDEISTLLKWGAERGYERSQAGDAVVDVRTSSHAWCLESCDDDPVVVALRQRIEDLTGVPQSHYESFQLLKYEVGQFYKSHNDFIEKHAVQRHGPRILTFFMYFDEGVCVSVGLFH
ncbi:hypothetical protein ACHAXS_011509, partial [Conticribra weissflogii]